MAPSEPDAYLRLIEASALPEATARCSKHSRTRNTNATPLPHATSIGIREWAHIGQLHDSWYDVCGGLRNSTNLRNLWLFSPQSPPKRFESLHVRSSRFTDLGCWTQLIVFDQSIRYHVQIEFLARERSRSIGGSGEPLFVSNRFDNFLSIRTR